MNWYDQNFRVGVLGGGQLGRMLIREAVNIDAKLYHLDPSENAPCALLSSRFTQGSLQDFNTVYNFGKDKSVVTIEIENVNVDALKKLEEEGIAVYPQPDILEMVQDKGLQKQFYEANNIPTAPFYIVQDKEEIRKYRQEFPFMQKMRKGGYDGKGVTPLRNDQDLTDAFDAPSVLEKFVDFEKEISVIVARNLDGQIATFPVVEMEFNPEANLVEFLFAPAKISDAIEEKAMKIAKDLIDKLGMVGLLAVEMFVTKQGDVLVNEIAPRPHNSGHQTIEANITSQYEQHLRAILNLPLGETDIIMPSVMINLLGKKGFEGPVQYNGLKEALSIPGVSPHIYGKTHTKPFRKMGHVTITNQSLDEAKQIARELIESIEVIA